MGSKSICEIIVKVKAYLGIISLQFGYAGMYIISAVCLKHGMNQFVLSLYRLVFATIAIAPFALFFERKTRPKMTLSVFWKILVLAFLEPVLDQNLYYVALKYTSASFATACMNVVPAFTFLMATIFRLEKVDIRKIPSQAKIIGTIVTVAGAMLMTIYRGPVLNIFGTHVVADHATKTAAAHSAQLWVLGTLAVLGGCVGWTAFFILQSYAVKEYPAELSLTAWICFMGSIECGVVSLVMVRDIKAFALGWDSRLIASVYTGVVGSGFAYYVQNMVNKERGPVFVTVFNPLCMIITAAMGTIILHELLHLGSVIGAVIIVLGLYTVVWGKSKEFSAATTNDKGGKAQDLPIINDDTTIKTITNKSNDKNNTLDII